MKQRVYVQTDNGVRVYINPSNIADLVANGALINPDITNMKRIPMHIWDIKGKKIVSNQKKLKQYYKDIKCDDCLKKLSFYERFKAWLKG